MTVLSQGAAAVVGVLVAAFLGFGAVEELIVRGVRGGEVQPLIVGLLGTVVSLLLALASLALAWSVASASSPSRTLRTKTEWNSALARSESHSRIV